MKKNTIFSLILLALLSACSNRPTSIPGSISTSIPSVITPASLLGTNAQQGKILIKESSGFYIANPDGTHADLVLPHSDDIYNAALSNDKTRVAYFASGILSVKNIETGEISQINQAFVGGTAFGMGWSPNDEIIGLDCAPGTTNVTEICLFTVRDGHLQILTHAEQFASANQMISGGGAEFGNWSEDGAQIVFDNRFFPQNSGNAQGRIQIVNVQTGEVHTVFDELRQGRISMVVAPVISPDGKTVLFVGKYAGKGEVFQVNADGSGLRQVTKSSHTYDITSPVWSPYGKAFFAFTARDGDPNIIGTPTLYSLDGEVLEQLNIDFGQVRSWVK
jgi:Tol biopolymer transport system component